MFFSFLFFHFFNYFVFNLFSFLCFCFQVCFVFSLHFSFFHGFHVFLFLCFSFFIFSAFTVFLYNSQRPPSRNFNTTSLPMQPSSLTSLSTCPLASACRSRWRLCSGGSGDGGSGDDGVDISICVAGSVGVIVFFVVIHAHGSWCHASAQCTWS